MTIANQSLNIIRAQADALGITYHHRAGIEKIQGLIDVHLTAENELEAEKVEATKTFKMPNKPVIPMSAGVYKKKELASNRKKVSALIRVRVQCMDVQKKEWPGEIFSVGSAKLGTYKKYVPFGNVEWHIPKIIYDMMMEKQCSSFYTKVDERGRKTRVSKLISAFAIEVLPPLTEEELTELGNRQALQAA
jgi:hypothetical protein